VPEGAHESDKGERRRLEYHEKGVVHRESKRGKKRQREMLTRRGVTLKRKQTAAARLSKNNEKGSWSNGKVRGGKARERGTRETAEKQESSNRRKKKQERDSRTQTQNSRGGGGGGGGGGRGWGGQGNVPHHLRRQGGGNWIWGNKHKDVRKMKKLREGERRGKTGKR